MRLFEIGGARMRSLAGALIVICTSNFANAAGWEHVHRYAKPSGKCESGTEILASHYALKGRTATGAIFNPNANTAAARTWALGTILRVTNPHTGQSVTVTINDRGPFGIAYTVGARLDLARGAALRIGMHSAQYVCVSLPGDNQQIEAKAEPVAVGSRPPAQ
jgi:rare lipoprotein A